MKRSEINAAIADALTCFHDHHWALPPNPRWDVTDFGLGDFPRYGLILVNLAEEPEYCEKLMFARAGQETPAHTHQQKKEDIICRSGILRLQLWQGHPEEAGEATFTVPVCAEPHEMASGETLDLYPGERVTLVPGVYHAFWPLSPVCIIGEVSTANDDQNDNFFVRDDIGRFPELEEDEPPLLRLLSETDV